MYRVLLVEDDPMVTSINKKYVDRLTNFEVVGCAGTGQEALELVDKLFPDLILLDIYMPQQSGIEVLREIRHKGFATDVILVTAAQDIDTITESLRLGAVDYLIKPYSFTRLKEALDTFLKRQDALSEKEELSQLELDQLNPRSHHTSSIDRNSLPKCLDAITLERLVRTMQEAHQWLSVRQLSNKLELSQITVRRYLDYLAEHDLVNVNLRYGKRGRPTRIFTLKR